MTKYNTEHTPPAPVARIFLRNTDTEETIPDVPMLLDTGADITLLPRASCEQIGVSIQKDESLELTGFDGSVSVPDFVQLDFVFLNKLFRGKFLVYDYEEGIIGRDVLNEFKLVFDGPNHDWAKSE